jgi:uncharacterized membrane protein
MSGDHRRCRPAYSAAELIAFAYGCGEDVLFYASDGLKSQGAPQISPMRSLPARQMQIDARRLLGHPEQNQEDVGGAAGANALRNRAFAAEAGRARTGFPAARPLGLSFRPQRRDVLWQLTADGRQAFLNAPGVGTAAAGCLAYAAATLLFSLILLKPGSWDDIRGMSSETLPWFLSSAVLVAISQAFVYASLAVAPLLVVTPILQLSLVFRLLLSQCINRDYEVINAAVLVGALTAVLGSILVSLDTDVLMKLLDLPPSLTDFLRYRLAGG